jgi:hypothetical protein
VRKPQVRVFSRHGCHLCEDMLSQLAELQRSQQFTVESVDVDGDMLLGQRYGDAVPVLECDDIEICRHYLDEKALTDYFRRLATKVS